MLPHSILDSVAPLNDRLVLLFRRGEKKSGTEAAVPVVPRPFVQHTLARDRLKASLYGQGQASSHSARRSARSQSSCKHSDT